MTLILGLVLSEYIPEKNSFLGHCIDTDEHYEISGLAFNISYSDVLDYSISLFKKEEEPFPFWSKNPDDIGDPEQEKWIQLKRTLTSRNEVEYKDLEGNFKFSHFITLLETPEAKSMLGNYNVVEIEGEWISEELFETQDTIIYLKSFINP